MTSTTIPPPQPTRRRRGGRPALDGSQKRVHPVNVHFAPAEFSYLQMQARAAAVSPAQFIRQVSLSATVPVGIIPDEYRQAWASLARLSGNLNQLSHHMNQLALQGELFNGYKPIIEKLVLELPNLRSEVEALRRILLKASCE